MPAPRNILHMTPSVRLLGARQSLLSLATHLDPARYLSIVCAQEPGALTEALEPAGVPCRFIKTGWWRKARYWPLVPFALARLRSLCVREKIDLIHCNEIYPNPFACHVAARLKIPVVTHMRLTVTPRQIENYKLRKADRIVVVSGAAGSDFDVWPDKADRVSVVYNGIDLEAYRSPLTKAEARARLGWPADCFIAAQLATWAPRKRQHIAIEAFAAVADELPRARLMLIGGAARTQTEYTDALRRQIAEMGFGDRIVMLPFTDDVAAIYRAIDLNLLISGEEGFGRTIVESAAAGVPTIGARAGGIPEIIEHERTGWLIDVDDAKDLAKWLRRLAKNPSLREEMGRKANSEAERRFSIQGHVSQMMALFDRVAEKGQK